MKDEIKEILDYLKSKYDIVDELGNDYKKVKFKDCKLLLDYITNLQEEKDDAIQCLKYYEKTHFIKPAINNTKLTMELANAYMKDINNSQTKINKATEWIKNNIYTYEDDSDITIYDWDSLANPKELLNILQGSDKE